MLRDRGTDEWTSELESKPNTCNIVIKLLKQKRIENLKGIPIKKIENLLDD